MRQFGACGTLVHEVGESGNWAELRLEGIEFGKHCDYVTSGSSFNRTQEKQDMKSLPEGVNTNQLNSNKRTVQQTVGMKKQES